MRALALLVLAGCGNALPGPGACTLAAGAGTPVVTPVTLTGGSIGFDDLAYSADLGKVIAAPYGSARLFLVDPDTLAFTSFAVPGGVASADGKGDKVVAVDRGNARLLVYDQTGHELTRADLGGGPDYVRASPTSDEIWVTLPGDGRVDYYSLAGAKLGSISVADPEGLTFDGAGHAFVNDSGNVVEIDVATHAILGRWSDGCGRSHGFPQPDLALGLVAGGCYASGGVGIVSTTTGLRSGFEAGGGAAIVAGAPSLHHLYVRGDPGDSLAILGLCADGSVTKLGSAPITNRGHGAVADGRGHVFVCDSIGGGLLRVTDPY